LTEFFDDFDFDLEGLSLTFTPDGSTSSYSAHAVPISTLPVNPATHAALVVGDDAFALCTLSGGKNVKLYSQSYSRFYVGSNGYITFGSGDTMPFPSLDGHFNRPRISGWFFDLDPGSGGTVRWKQLSDRVVVTFSNVPDWYFGESHTFQYQLYFDGKITLSWLGIDLPFGLVGLSTGSGTPADFLESDLSDFGLDYDSDGIPNDWEMLYFGGATSCIAAQDSDGDGFNNLQEYISGMHPLNGASFLQMTEFSPDLGATTNYVVKWNAVEGREYSVLRSTDLQFGNFQILDDRILYPQNTYTDAVNEVQDACFYRIDVKLEE
jgi:hypothetical protein